VLERALPELHELADGLAVTKLDVGSVVFESPIRIHRLHLVHRVVLEQFFNELKVLVDLEIGLLRHLALLIRLGVGEVGRPYLLGMDKTNALRLIVVVTSYAVLELLVLSGLCQLQVALALMHVHSVDVRLALRVIYRVLLLLADQAVQMREVLQVAANIHIHAVLPRTLRKVIALGSRQLDALARLRI